MPRAFHNNSDSSRNQKLTWQTARSHNFYKEYPESCSLTELPKNQQHPSAVSQCARERNVSRPGKGSAISPSDDLGHTTLDVADRASAVSGRLHLHALKDRHIFDLLPDAHASVLENVRGPLKDLFHVLWHKETNNLFHDTISDTLRF